MRDLALIQTLLAAKQQIVFACQFFEIEIELIGSGLTSEVYLSDTVLK
ncbi:hypothetical protein [Marinobacter changyiensis]|nr:hypothetical protein [Marinobacter changyiensis]